jgi:hypothetical protein
MYVHYAMMTGVPFAVYKISYKLKRLNEQIAVLYYAIHDYSLVLCLGLKKKIAPLPFFHGCPKRRLKG